MRSWGLLRTGLGVGMTALSLGGCGSGAAAGASGDRIQVEVIEGSDGSRVFVGLYDSEMKTECAYTTAADEKLRCLPTPSDKLRLVWSDDVHFSDSECTQPLAEWLGSTDENGLFLQPPPFGVVVFGDEIRADLTHVFPVLDRYAGGHAVYRRDVDGGSCETYSLDSDAYVQLGAEIPASKFVEGTEVID